MAELAAVVRSSRHDRTTASCSRGPFGALVVHSLSRPQATATSAVPLLHQLPNMFNDAFHGSRLVVKMESGARTELASGKSSDGEGGAEWLCFEFV